MFKNLAAKAKGGSDGENLLSPDWAPQQQTQPSTTTATPSSGGGAKSMFMRGKIKNAIKLQPQKKSALSIIREAR